MYNITEVLTLVNTLVKIDTFGSHRCSRTGVKQSGNNVLP